MDLPLLEGMSRYWMRHPPVHISMAAYVGWGKGSAQQQDEGDFEAMMASLPTTQQTGE